MEKIIITGNRGSGKSSLTFNLAYGLAIEGRSVGIVEVYNEKSFMAEIMGLNENGFDKPKTMQGIIKLMLISKFKGDEKIESQEYWEDIDYLLIDIDETELDKINYIENGKSLIILNSNEKFEEQCGKILKSAGKLNLKNIGIVENKVNEYKREVKTEYNIISKIPVEEGIKIEKFDGIPYIYKKYNTKGIIELKEIVDRIIDFEYGDEESSVKKESIGICLNKDGKVAESIESADKIIKVNIDGMLYRVGKKEILKEKIDEERILLLTSKIEQNVEIVLEEYIEKINEEKRHCCH